MQQSNRNVPKNQQPRYEIFVHLLHLRCRFYKKCAHQKQRKKGTAPPIRRSLRVFFSNGVSNQNCTSLTTRYQKTSKHSLPASKRQSSTLHPTCTGRTQRKGPSKHGSHEKILPWHRSQKTSPFHYGAGCANKLTSASTSYTSAGRTRYSRRGQPWKVNITSMPPPSHHQAHR